MADRFAYLLRNAFLLHNSNPSEVLPEGFVFTDVKQRLILPLKVGYGMQDTATSFKQAFLSTDKFQAAHLSVLQQIIKAIELYRFEFDKLESHEVPVSGDPLHVLIETVPGAEIDPEVDVQQYGNSQDVIDTRAFLTGVPDNVPIIEYRIVVLARVKQGAVDFFRCWERVFLKAKGEYLKYQRQDSKEMNARTKNQREMGMNAFVPQDEYSLLLNEHERYMLVHNEEMLANALDCILGAQNLTDPSTMAQLAGNYYSWAANPMHIRARLSPNLYFMYPTAGIDPVQAKASSYVSDLHDDERWTFPVPNRVVKVSPSRQTIMSFMRMMLPDYQVRALHDMFTEMRQMVLTPECRAFFEYDQSPDADAPDFMSLDQANLFDDDADAQGVVANMGMDVAATFGTFDDLTNPNRIANAQLSTEEVGDGVRDIQQLLDRIPVKRNGAIKPYNGEALDRESFLSMDSEEARQMMNVHSKPDTSAFHFLLFLGEFNRKVLKRRIAETPVAADKLHLLRMHRLKMFRQYESLCMKPTSDVSAARQACNRWFLRECIEGRPWLGHDEPLADPSMTLFGNMILRRLIGYEEAMLVVNAHGIILLISFGMLDAYRVTDEMHFHKILCGEAETGKSFALLVNKSMKIPDTVKFYGPQTARAANTEFARTDQIFISEELDPDQICESSKGGKDKSESLFKNWLTSGKHELNAFVQVGNKRANKDIQTQDEACVFGATNLSKDRLSNAVRTRTGPITYQYRKRITKSVLDVSAVADDIPELVGDMKEAFLRQVRAEQFLHIHVNGLIAISALPDVTMGAFEKISQVFCKYLETNYMIVPDRRALVRAKAIVRAVTISHAMEMLFSTPVSPHWQKPFQLQQLYDAIPFLHDKTEFVFWALDSIQHEMISELRTEFSQLMARNFERRRAQVHAAQGTEQAYRDLYLDPLLVLNLHRAGGDTRYSTPPIPSIQPAGAAGGSRFALQAATQNSESEAQAVYNKAYMWAYVRIDMTKLDFIRSLHADFEDSSIRPKDKDLSDLIYNLSKMTITSTRYEWDAAALKPRPVAGTRVAHPLILPNKDRDKTFIHITLLETTNAVRKAIEFCVNKHDEYPYRFVTAQPYSPETPHIVRAWQPNAAQNGREHRVSQAGRVITQSSRFAFQFARQATTQHEPTHIQMQCGFDQESERLHCSKTGLDADDSRVKFNLFEAALRECNYISPGAARYPDCLVGDLHEQIALDSAPAQLEAPPPAPPAAQVAHMDSFARGLASALHSEDASHAERQPRRRRPRI